MFYASLIFLAPVVNILKLGNSVLTEENLAKCNDSSTYMPRHVHSLAQAKKIALKREKIQSFVAFFWYCAFLRVLPNGSHPEPLGNINCQKTNN